MALQGSTSTPLDPILYSEWQTQLAVGIGVAYSSLLANDQALFDRLLNAAYEKATQRAAHQPWGQRRTTIAVTGDTVGQDANGNEMYTMPVDFRHLILISESDGTTRTRAIQADHQDYWNNFDGADTHPWTDDGKRSRWFFTGITTDTPPKQQWTRVGGMATVTATVLYRPYLRLVGSSNSDTVIPAAEQEVIRNEFAYKWALAHKDFEEAAVYRQAREDDVAHLEINDRVEQEDPIRQGLDDQFARQMRF